MGTSRKKSSKKRIESVRKTAKKVGAFKIPDPPIGGGIKVLTKAEKMLRTKLKSSIRENINSLESSGMKRTARDRTNLRDDLRKLGKIVGEKDAAKFARQKRDAIFKNPKVRKTKPRARK